MSVYDLVPEIHISELGSRVFRALKKAMDLNVSNPDLRKIGTECVETPKFLERRAKVLPLKKETLFKRLLKLLSDLPRSLKRFVKGFSPQKPQRNLRSVERIVERYSEK